ncbi:MAG: S8 family peptidase [Bacteroidota bacterium]
MRPVSLALAAVLTLAACSSDSVTGPEADAELPPDLAVLEDVPVSDVVPQAPDPDPASDRYIVVLAEAPASKTGRRAPSLDAVVSAVEARGGDVDVTFETALTGFAAELSPAEVATLESDSRVAFVEPDLPVRALATQSGAPWGLDRIDQRDGTDGSYTYTTSASNVTAYIIDTGIRTSHVDFGSRASNGFDAFGGNGQDCNGHGTHVAGTVGGSTYGVAKGVRLVGVRVLDCNGSGSTSGVIAGVDWVTQVASGPSVANMSLGGGASSALDTAVRNSIASGVTYAVAAGNENRNACNGSPARVSDALTVGATSSSDARASFSNYGSCVDLFAPGVSIRSAWYTSNTATTAISGTSMASPHVAGAAALVLAGSPGASPATVNAAVLGAVTDNAVGNARSANNDLLFVGSGGSQPPPPPPSQISLDVQGRYYWRYSIVDLSWSGVQSSQVDVYVNGSRAATTTNDGAQSYNLGWNRRGTYAFTICERGTSSCSPSVSVRF